VKKSDDVFCVKGEKSQWKYLSAANSTKTYGMYTSVNTHTHTVTPFVVCVSIGVTDVQIKFEVYLKMLLLSKTKDF